MLTDTQAVDEDVDTLEAGVLIVACSDNEDLLIVEDVAVDDVLPVFRLLDWPDDNV